jgi:DNA adenine methylase
VDATAPSLPGLEAEGDTYARPFLKWAGGKTRLLRTLLPYTPARIRDYYEPFLGGGAVFFALQNRVRGRCLLSDLNGELINAWRAVRDVPVQLMDELATYSGRDAEADYYEIRLAAPEEPVARAARFIYLNQTSWNGLWRVNRWGTYNVPWGARAFRGLDRDALLKVTSTLQRTELREADFREALHGAGPGDFVYLDPPYLPVSDTSKFSGYTERRFRSADLAELAAICRTLSDRGVRWILSNRDTPLVRELFRDARIVSLTTRRSVAAQNRRDVQPIDSPETIIIGEPRL